MKSLSRDGGRPLALVLFACLGLFQSGCAEPEKAAPKKASGVTLHLCSYDEELWQDDEKPLYVQLNSAGQFLSVDGWREPDDKVGGLLRLRSDLVVNVIDDKKISLSTLVKALNNLRLTAKPGTDARVYIRLDGLEVPKPKK